MLITGDKDANQLATDLTKIVNMKKGVSEVVLYGPDEVFEKYGIRVDQFIDFLALMGDSSDNIPGVPGIGPKSATKLLQDFGDLEGIYANLDKLKGKQKENIENNKEAAFVSRKAATIYCDVPLDLDFENIYFPSFDKEKLSETFLKYSLRSSLTGVLKLIGEDLTINKDYDSSQRNKVPATNNHFEPPVYAGDEPKINYENYVEGQDAKDFIDNLIKSDAAFAVAISEKMSEAPVQTNLFEISEEENYRYPQHKNLILAVSNNENTGLLSGDDAVSALIDISKKCSNVICENAKNILELVYDSDTGLDSFITKEELYNTNFYDISLAAYLLNSSKSEYSAIDAYQQVFGKMLPTLDANIEEGLKKTDEIYIEKKNKNLKLRLARRAAVSFAIKKSTQELLKQCFLDKLYEEIEVPLTKVLVDVERIGSKIDVGKLEKLSFDSAKALESLKTEIINLAGEDFNIDSPKQLGHILFEVLGLPAKKKTKTGYSTNAEVLEDLSTIHALPAKVIEYREYAKLKSTYIDALPNLTDANDLVHTTFHQKKTTTGRLSSSDPNIQNIPTRTEYGNQIRECFIPLYAGDTFVSADYSQIELRVLAHLSQDKGLIDAFNSGEDFHSYTAANVFNVPVKDVTANMRRTAKAVNFGIVYGQQSYGLSQTLKISVGEAKDMIERYFSTFPDVRKYLDEVVAFATEHGYAETMFGRRRYIAELNAANKNFKAFGQRTAMNHPMQGSAADIIKIAMINVQKAVFDADIKASCMMQVHDELDFSCAKDDIDTLSHIVKDKMENAVKLNVPLVVDIATGEN